MRVSDDELIEQIQLGNENAAEELIKRYYASILRYCRWHCSDSGEAEDLTQETFFKLFKNISQYKGKGKFKTYLYTIANHLCIDENRKVRLYPLEDVEKPVRGSFIGESPARGNLVSGSFAQGSFMQGSSRQRGLMQESDGIQRVEDQDEINYLLKTLSPEQREAVILRYGEQLSFAEIAKVTGCNIRTAQSRVRWALKNMRKGQHDDR